MRDALALFVFGFLLFSLRLLCVSNDIFVQMYALLSVKENLVSSLLGSLALIGNIGAILHIRFSITFFSGMLGFLKNDWLETDHH